jgi:hypothetical protein
MCPFDKGVTLIWAMEKSALARRFVSLCPDKVSRTLRVVNIRISMRAEYSGQRGGRWRHTWFQD